VTPPIADGEQRVRDAVASGSRPSIDDVTQLLTTIDGLRAESAARWDAMGRLAPAAKANRVLALDRARLLTELRTALAAPIDDAARQAWIARITRAL
jgi:hypothetical protein